MKASTGLAAAMLLGFASAITACDEATEPPTPTLQRIEVTADREWVGLGMSGRATARVFDSSQQEVHDATVFWKTSDSLVLAIDGDGRFFGMSEGRAWVIGAVESLRDSAELIVRGTPPTLPPN